MLVGQCAGLTAILSQTFQLDTHHDFRPAVSSTIKSAPNSGFECQRATHLPSLPVRLFRRDVKASHSQVLFTGHCGRLVSLAVSPCGCFVATGQEGRNASVIIWDPATGHVSEERFSEKPEPCCKVVCHGRNASIHRDLQARFCRLLLGTWACCWGHEQPMFRREGA